MPGALAIVRSRDPRAARTHARLHAAVVELCLDKGFQNITVDHLIERAEVTRATFYAHFRDKEQLLTSVADEMVDDVLARFGDDGAAERNGERLVVLFEEARRQPDRVRVVLRGEGDGIALRRFMERLVGVIASTDAAAGRRRSELATRAFAGQIVAVLAWWLELARPAPPRKVVAELRSLVVEAQASATPRPSHKAQSHNAQKTAEPRKDTKK